MRKWRKKAAEKTLLDVSETKQSDDLKASDHSSNHEDTEVNNDTHCVCPDGGTACDMAESPMNSMVKNHVCQPQTSVELDEHTMAQEETTADVRTNDDATNESVLLQCSEVCKTIHKKTLLRQISFSLDYGKVLGILGAEGAGKTLLFRILCGMSFPDRGAVTIEGHDLFSAYEKAMAHVACVFSTRGFYRSLSARANLRMLCIGVGDQEITRALHVVGLDTLDEVEKKRVGTYTTMQLTLLSLARALCLRPHLILLDDVFLVLNPWQAKQVGSLLKRIAAAENIGILVAFRSREDAEGCCDYVGFLEEGTLHNVTSMHHQVQQDAFSVYRFYLGNCEAAKALLCGKDAFVVKGQGENYLDLSVSHNEIPAYNKLFVEHQIEIYGIEVPQNQISSDEETEEEQ